MARQIAHEIKNPLTPMQLNIQLLQRLKRDNDPRWEAKFDEVSRSLLEQIEILSRTASDFSTLSKLLSNEATTTEDLVAILREEESLYASTAGVTVSLETDLATAPANIHRQQIIRAFMNIIGNAIQAIEKHGGNVLITLGREGDMFRVSIEDDGEGVKEDFIPKLFSPNFTTKVGGSGLGLAICKDIIEQNGGTIGYERSQRLGGASFVVRLPAAG
jgi:signal transduction histidine kinase